MNYQHVYHAGNHADVFKHLVLMALIDYYRQKEKPFCVIDTHAGSGKYNLLESNNTEYSNGVGLLSQKSHTITNELIRHYLLLQNDITQFNGSPFIAKSYLRAHDELILIEKAEKSFQTLKKNLYHYPQIHLHHVSAEIALKSLLPPPIKRGIVFIDPSYEETDEYERWLFQLKNAIQKFSTAAYALWYPIKSKSKIQYFYEKIKKLTVNSKEKLLLEFCPLPSDVGTRFNGSGILLVNPPFEFEKNFKPVLQQLLTLLKQDSHGFQHILKV